jgi:signal transduction histidine kinase
MSVPSQDLSSVIRVLVVHPMRVERVRLIRPLRAHFGRNVEVWEASGADEAEERLGQGFFDVALVAEQIEGQSGLDLAARLTKVSPETATLLVATEDSPALAAEVAQSAVCDYVVRGQVDDQQLSRAISGAIRQIHLQRDYQQMVRRMNESHDQMDHLVRALSHDMNANFMLMESSFSTLQRSLETEQTEDFDLKEVATHVRACMTESRRFLNDLVGLARTGRVEMEPGLTDTDGVVEEVLYEQRELLSDRNVAVDVAEKLPKLWCNRHRLKQVITNLVRNAVKHGTDPSNPRLAIQGEGDCDESGTALLRVHDNGPGIPPEWREEIFMPGRRAPGTLSEGSGMGLAIVRKIVQHYGGAVRVESPSEGGTAFEIELPTVGGMESGAESLMTSVGDESIPEDRRLDHDRPHEDPQLHSHRVPSRRSEPRRRFSGYDG